MDDITTQFEECLRRHLRSAKPNPINYDVELVQLGLDSMTAVAVLLDATLVRCLLVPAFMTWQQRIMWWAPR